MQVLKRLKQEDWEFKASLSTNVPMMNIFIMYNKCVLIKKEKVMANFSYMVRPYEKTKTNHLSLNQN